VFLCLFLGSSMAQDVAIDASRTADTWAITRTYPLLGSRRIVYPLASVRGARLETRHGKGGPQYDVVLDLAGVDLSLSRRHGGRARINQQRIMETFLENPAVTSLHLAYDQGTPCAILFLIPLAVIAFAFRSLWQAVRIRPDREGLVVSRNRWPLPAWTVYCPRDQVRDVRVDERRGRNQMLYRIVLVLASGEDLPLLPAWGDGERRHDAFARRLRALLLDPGAP
jgi:hypothetical protein